MFHNKWLTLVNRENNSMGIKGYLKCDLIMFYENESIVNISLSKTHDSRAEAIEIDEKYNLYLYNIYKMCNTLIHTLNNDCGIK